MPCIMSVVIGKRILGGLEMAVCLRIPFNLQQARGQLILEAIVHSGCHMSTANGG